MKHKILIVDDEPANLRMLERLFRDNHDVITAESGSEAIEVLVHHDIALIISDQRMPGMTGIEFLKKAAELRPQTVRMILTGYTDVADLVEAINSGVIYKYITKPWVNIDLMQTVQRGIEHYETIKKQHSLANENERLERRVEMTVTGFINAVGEMMAQKNSSLAEHCRRTSQYAGEIAERLSLGTDDMQQLTLASLLHEVPNMRLPFKITLSKTSLTPSQFQVIQTNYESGLGLISAIPDLEEVADIIRYQHERYDGTGFFSGLSGNKIPLLSRILAVASAFDEVSSGTSPAFLATQQEKAASLDERAGSEFDPRIVAACNETAWMKTVVFELPSDSALAAAL